MVDSGEKVVCKRAGGLLGCIDCCGENAEIDVDEGLFAQSGLDEDLDIAHAAH